MEPKGSLLHFQVPATCTYPDPDQSIPCPQSHFLKIDLNIILPSNPGSSKWSLSLRFPYQNPIYTHLSLMRATCPAHLILLDLITRTILGEEYRSLSSSSRSFLQYPLRHKYSPQHPTLRHLSVRSSLNVSDQVPHPYKTTGKIIVLCNLIYMFLDRKLQDQRLCTEW